MAEFPSGGSNAVVLARADAFPDALVGAPLAAAKDAPLLFTEGATLPAVTQTEIQRVLPIGGTVYLLGGTAAIPGTIVSQLVGLGYETTRYGGSDRYATAVLVANALGNPGTVFLATGTDFADALAAGPAATIDSGAVLLTDGSTMPSATSSYLLAHGVTEFAVGGPAFAADPSAKPSVGSDRYATSQVVATNFFSSPTAVGVASGTAFPDALAGAADLARAHGPLLLSDPGMLPTVISQYLSGIKTTITASAIFGGTSAISSAVQTAIRTALAQQ
jgi:putative cell wall-binding protein